MDKKISIVDFYSSDSLTAILTYAFLRKKEQSGYVLTEDEKDLLYNNVHKTFLSMAFNNNYYYPCNKIPQGFETKLNLGAFVKYLIISQNKYQTGQGLFIECDIQNILDEALSMIPAGSMFPQKTRAVQVNTVKFSEDKIVLIARIDTEFGTIVKGYAYKPVTMELIRKYYPDFINNLEKNVYQSNKILLKFDFIYTAGRVIFDNDFEPLFYGQLRNVPKDMCNKIICDLENLIKTLTEF